MEDLGMIGIEKQKKFFNDNKLSILKEYAGKVIVISNTLDISVFNTLEDGYNFGIENFGYGNFLLKDCTQGNPEVQVITPIITLL